MTAGKKRCKRCGVWRDLEDFVDEDRAQRRRGPYCAKCLAYKKKRRELERARPSPSPRYWYEGESLAEMRERMERIRRAEESKLAEATERLRRDRTAIAGC